MTQEEKAKAYDEAIKRAIKHRNHDGLTLEQYETIDIIFPELKESEEEKIRKRILLSLQKDIIATKNSGCSTTDLEKCISWLEKQGEQKPFDYENANIQQKDWAEIPFGTKDSELQEATYIIPEGFHAEIKRDEVLIKKGEQKPTWSKEDEKMVDNILTPLAARYPFDIYQPMYNWLKALKQRIVGG